MIEKIGRRCPMWAATAASVVCLVLACLTARSGPLQSGSVRTPGEICYASGNQLWLRNLSAGTTIKLTDEKDKRATYHLPQWIDHNRILFIRSETSDGDKTQVGIIDVRSKTIKWFPCLAGADSIGYNSAKIDYIKVADNQSESDVVDVYFGRCDPTTAKATSKRVYGTWGGVDYHRIYAWPQPSMRILPVGTSDVSDQVVVYDTALGKCVTPGLLSDRERRKLFGIGEYGIPAVFTLAPGPNGILAMYVVAQQDGLCIIKPGVSKVVWVSKTAANVGSVVISRDGRWLAYDRTDVNSENRSLWISSTSDPKPWKVCEGWDADFRP